MIDYHHRRVRKKCQTLDFAEEDNLNNIVKLLIANEENIKKKMKKKKELEFQVTFNVGGNSKTLELIETWIWKWNHTLIIERESTEKDR